jgi:hypothetical protein
MAEVISFSDVVRARRRVRQQRETEACTHIIEANLRLALELFSTSPDSERPVRARQVRQLSELLEYVVTALAR